VNATHTAPHTRAGFLVALLLVGGAAPLMAQEAALSLDDAVRVALERNQELEAARLEVGKSRAQVREAWSSVFPRVDLTTQYTRNVDAQLSFLPARIFDPNAPEDELVGMRFGTDNVWSNQVRVEQPIFQANAFIGVGAAGRYRALQEEVFRGAEQQVATRVRLAYFDALLADEALRLTEASLARVRESFEEARVLYRAGMVSEYDALRLEVELRNLEPRVRQARSQAVAARRTLAAEMGVEDGAALRLAGSLATLTLGGGEVTAAETTADNRALVAYAARRVPVDGGDRPDGVAVALQGRSDLRQLQMTRELRTAELRAEQAEYLPRVALWGTHTLTALQDGSPAWFGGISASQRQVGIQVTMPIFSGMQRPARVQQRRAAVEQVAAQQRLARVRAENEVLTLVDALDEARERVETQRLAVELARRGWQIARLENREGIGSQLQVTDAENALRESEFNYAQAVYDYLVARARLDAAVGEAA
jgi:outer membrane protein